jgi:HAD superfamily hydrolase (TIGR01509 family)
VAVEAIIFDFDGVIIDTETAELEVWQAFYRTHGLDIPSELWAKRIGYNEADAFHPARYFEQITGTALSEAQREDQFQRYVERCARQPVLPGVRELIEAASQRGIKLAIASSAYREWVDRWLRQHHLSHLFDCIRTRGDVKRGKPAPDLYLSAADCLGVPVKHCIAIEDSPAGISAALAAGMRCITVPNPLSARMALPEATLRLNSLAEMDCETLLAQF